MLRGVILASFVGAFALLGGCGDAGENVGNQGVCAPQSAEGDQQCDKGLGVRWTGSQCVSVGGCECLGEDCDALYDNFDACQSATRNCNSDCRPNGCERP